MALISRLSRLFEADFHAVLDRIEEPDLQLRQAVREMQFELDQERQRHKLLQHEARQLERAGARLETELQGFDAELDLCLAARKDVLARDLVRRKLGAERQRQLLAERRDEIETECRHLAAQIDEHGQQLSSMQQKLELLVGDEQLRHGDITAHADAIRDEEIEIALLREKQRRAKS